MFIAKNMFMQKADYNYLVKENIGIPHVFRERYVYAPTVLTLSGIPSCIESQVCCNWPVWAQKIALINYSYQFWEYLNIQINYKYSSRDFDIHKDESTCVKQNNGIANSKTCFLY